MTIPAVGERVRIPSLTVPVWVQVPLRDVTGIVITDPFQNLHGRLVLVQLDPAPAVFAALREHGMVDTFDERVLVFPDEVQVL